MRSVLEENGQVSMVLEIEYFHGIGAFEVHFSKVPALKPPHPPACSAFGEFCSFSNYDTVFWVGGTLTVSRARTEERP
jgi:hypothetical protein